VKYLHSNDTVHRDIRMKNILINKKNEIMIIGFDDSIRANKYYLLESSCGTLHYLSPEKVKEIKYLGKPADI